MAVVLLAEACFVNSTNNTISDEVSDNNVIVYKVKLNWGTTAYK